MQCTASAVPPNIRSTGKAELVGDMVLTCTGGTPTGLGQPIPQGTIAVILDTPISSRLLAAGWSEALLLVDEPAIQVVCTNASGACALQGNGTGIGTYDGSIGRANVYQGQPASSNEIDFASVPLDPPGTNGVRTIRIVNIRGDATAASSSGKVNMQVSALGQTISVNTGQLVATAQPGASFTANSIQTGPLGITQFAVTMTEKFASALKTRTTAPSPGNSLAPTPAAQSKPGQSTPGSETGFYNPTYPAVTGRGNLSAAGLADTGTRVYVQISNPGSGVAIATNSAATLSSGGVVRLMTTDATGAGTFAPSGTCCGAVNLTPDSSGNVRAVFEVLAADPKTIESVDIPFFVTAGATAVTSLNISAGLAPLNSSGADFTSPLPRFTGTTALTVTGSVTPAPIQISTQQLQFVASQGGDSPGPQMVAITTNSSVQAAFSLVIDSGTQGSAAPSWLSVTRNSGLTPATLTVAATTGTLPIGTQNARIRVVPKDPTQQTIDIPVSFSITSSPPQMDVSPRSLSFTARAGSTGSLEQQLSIRNRGGGSVHFTASIVNNPGGGRLGAVASFLTDVTPSSGQTGPDAPVVLKVHASPQGLAAGVYAATIHISSDTSSTCNGAAANSCDIGVTLQVTNAGPILRLSSTGLRFLAIAGNPATRSQSIEVIDDGDPNSMVSYSSALLQGSDWLSVVNGTGVASPGKPGTITLMPAPAVSGFGAGPRYAVLKVTDANSQNSPQLLTAILDVAPASTAPFPDPAPSGLVLTAAQGGGPLTPSIVSIAVSSTKAVAYQASAVTRDGASWLSVAPATGMTSSANPAQLQIQVTPAALATGVYTGDVTVGIGATARAVRVTLVVQPAALKSVSHAGSVCAPARLVLTDTAFADGSTVPAGYPALLTMFANDDCGSPVTDASVVTSFDNGDPPVTLSGDGTGYYSASWVPGRVAASVTVTFSATDPTLAPPPNSVLRLGAVSANSIPPPVQAPGGTVNNNNPVLGGALAPGTIASVYGSGLGSVSSVTTAAPLPTIYSGTQIFVGGNPVPLYYVSPGQVNIQIPFELAPNQKYPVLAIFNNVPAIPDSITVAPATPAVIAYADGTVKAQHAADFSLVDSGHPAKPGEALVIYLVGMGATNPVTATGQGSPSSPLANAAVGPTMTLDGENVVPFFAGLTPGFVGLYQINFTVPADARTGSLSLTVTQGNLSANVTQLPVAH